MSRVNTELTVCKSFDHRKNRRKLITQCSHLGSHIDLILRCTNCLVPSRCALKRARGGYTRIRAGSEPLIGLSKRVSVLHLVPEGEWVSWFHPPPAWCTRLAWNRSGKTDDGRKARPESPAGSYHAFRSRPHGRSTE